MAARQYTHQEDRLTALEVKMDTLTEAVDRVEKKLDIVANIPASNTVAINSLEGRIVKLEKSLIGNKVAGAVWFIFGGIMVSLIIFALTHKAV